MILSGNSIKKLAKQGMITPFVDHKEYEYGMSYGLSVASYDFRLGTPGTIWFDYGDFNLLHTLEKFKLPKNVSAQILDKSSLARKGLSLFNTWIDPGFEGHITIEASYQGISNEDFLFSLQEGTPLGQIAFFQVDEETEGYQGKYQHQGNIPVSSVYERGAWGEALKRTDFGDEKLSIKQVETRRQLEASILNYGKRSSYEYPD